MSFAAAPQRARSAHVLMVDVNKSGLAARKAILEEQGAEVVTAAATEDAMQLLADAPFDLLVTDHRGSRLNGVELIARVRQSYPHLPIILLCNDAEALGLTEASTGADLVLSKSANEVAHLIRGVSRLLRPQRRKPPARQRASARKQQRKA